MSEGPDGNAVLSDNACGCSGCDSAGAGGKKVMVLMLHDYIRKGSAGLLLLQEPTSIDRQASGRNSRTHTAMEQGGQESQPSRRI